MRNISFARCCPSASAVTTPTHSFITLEIYSNPVFNAHPFPMFFIWLNIIQPMFFTCSNTALYFSPLPSSTTIILYAQFILISFIKEIRRSSGSYAGISIIIFTSTIFYTNTFRLLNKRVITNAFIVTIIYYS